MSSSKYHREQAKVLAALALSAHNEAAAGRFNLAAMEHLERAQTLDGKAERPSDTPQLGAGSI